DPIGDIASRLLLAVRLDLDPSRPLGRQYADHRAGLLLRLLFLVLPLDDCPGSACKHGRGQDVYRRSSIPHHLILQAGDFLFYAADNAPGSACAVLMAPSTSR